MVVIRYEGPRGAPGMPELLDPTSRITALCRRKRHHDRAHDRRALLGRLGRPRDRPRRARRPTSAARSRSIEDGDTIVVDLNTDRLDCRELDDETVRARRAATWRTAAQQHGGVHPAVKPVTNRLLKRMRFGARPALEGAGMAIG